MIDRYEGRPLVRLLECYFLWCIGELPARDERALEAYAPKLSEILRHQGAWYEIIEAAVQLPTDIRARIASAWNDHLNNTTPDMPGRTPAEAAREFVEQNFGIEPAPDLWPVEVH
jgi:hypothetical protein